jgi:hypothetical protein
MTAAAGWVVQRDREMRCQKPGFFESSCFARSHVVRQSAHTYRTQTGDDSALGISPRCAALEAGAAKKPAQRSQTGIATSFYLVFLAVVTHESQQKEASTCLAGAPLCF